MLKSLGQWTSLSLKPRKIIPSTLTIVPSKPPLPERGQGEPVTLRNETRYVNFSFYELGNFFFFLLIFTNNFFFLKG